MGPNPELTDLVTKLGGLREIARAMGRSTARSQRLRNLDQSIAALEEQIARIAPTITLSETVIDNDTRRDLEAALRQAEVDHRAVAAREAVLRGQLEAMRKDLQTIDERTAQLNSVTARARARSVPCSAMSNSRRMRAFSDATEVNMTTSTSSTTRPSRNGPSGRAYSTC